MTSGMRRPAALVVVVVIAIGLFVKLQSTPSRSRFPRRQPGPNRPPRQHAERRASSVVGFRVQESFVGFSNDVWAEPLPSPGPPAAPTAR